jgi:hypothetical protein
MNDVINSTVLGVVVSLEKEAAHNNSIQVKEVLFPADNAFYSPS